MQCKRSHGWPSFLVRCFDKSVNFALEQSAQIAEIAVIAGNQFAHPFVRKMKIAAMQNEMAGVKRKSRKIFRLTDDHKDYGEDLGIEARIRRCV